MYLTCDNRYSTTCKRIAFVTCITCAHRTMFNYITEGIFTARTNTGVDTSFISTCFIAGTFGIYCTFWTTLWWTSHIIWQTWASTLISNHTTLCIWSTRWWYAWIYVIFLRRRHYRVDFNMVVQNNLHSLGEKWGKYIYRIQTWIGGIHIYIYTCTCALGK